MPTLAQRLRDEGKEKWMNEGKEKWMNEGRKEGKEKWMNEGRKEGKLEIARRMLREDFTIKQIAKFTGLSEEQLKKAFSEK